MAVFERACPLPVSAEEAFRWHARPGAFERCLPPWTRAELLSSEGGIAPGGRTVLRMKVGPLPIRWVANMVDPGDLGPFHAVRAFRDLQGEGPFAAWDHRHLFQAPQHARSKLVDHVEYKLPGGALGRALLGRSAAKELERTFAYRHALVARDLERHRRFQDSPPMKIAITGASGFVGSALVPFLTSGGHRVLRMVRRAPNGPDEVHWDPRAGTVDWAALEGVDAVVHLAGENIAGGRWSAERKERIAKSRAEGTQALAGALAKLARKPSVLVSASAIGIYGDRGDEWLDERSAPGDDFLAGVCRAWEAAAEPARAAGIRVVHPRTGIVLSPRGGALAKMLTPFRLGAGGKIGSGRQWMSWIHLDDLVGVLHHALLTPAIEGPLNAVAPNPVPNAGFTTTLGRVLNRPTVFPMPAFAARLAFGEMADALLLASQRVRPGVLESHGFRFAHPDLEGALRDLLGKRAS